MMKWCYIFGLYASMSDLSRLDLFIHNRSSNMHLLSRVYDGSQREVVPIVSRALI